MAVRPREFRGEAERDVPAPLEDCFQLLAAVDRYPEWCPEIVQRVDVLDRGAYGRPSRARMRMHVHCGVVSREFDLFLAIVTDPPRIVKLTRFTDHPTNQEFNATWLLAPGISTRMALTLDAKLRVPRYIPGGGVGDAIANGFVEMACARLAAAAPSSSAETM